MATKPSVLLDWINSDDPTKMTIPSAPAQLLGHVSGTAADPKIFNFAWNRLSHWISFLDATFNANGKDLNAANSTTITETVAPTASTVTLDAGGIKSWDASSNAIFSVTEPGVVTIGYNANDIISLTAGVLSVATATAADLVKLHALTPSAADLNLLLGAVGNGLLVADLTKLANIDASDAEIDQLDGNTVGGSSAGDIATIDDTQTLTNKTIDADNNTVSNLAHGSEVDDPTTGVHGVGGGDVVGTALTQTLTNKTLTSPKINEDVVLTSTSTEIDALVTAATPNAIIGDGTPGRILRISRVIITGNTGIIDSDVQLDNHFNGWSAAHRLVDVGGDTEFNMLAAGLGFTINNGGSGFTGTPVAILSVDVVYNDTGLLDDTNLDYSIVSNNLEFHLYQKNGTELSWITTINFPNVKKYEFYVTYLTDA